MQSSLGVQLVVARSEDINSQLKDLRQQVSFEANIQIWELFVQKQLKFVKAQLVSRLKPAVVWRELLHSVVREMNHFVVKVVNVVLLARRT
jgi:hypothetical protein